MTFRNFLIYYPERILWVAAAALGGLVLLASPFLMMLWAGSSVLLEPRNITTADRKNAPLSISLNLESKLSAMPLPNLQGEMTFSYDPPRPDGALVHSQLLVRLKKTFQSKRVSLPARLHLMYYQGDSLCFSEEETPFWVELKTSGGNQIEGKVYINTLHEGKIEAGSFSATAQDSPVQTAQEFPEGSPFRILAEARWWGHDLFQERYGEGPPSERIEIGAVATADLLEAKEGEWLSWNEGHWTRISSISEGKKRPIAQIHSIQGKNLFLEGWDLENHYRISLSPASGPSFKARPEELFSSIRVRSEKQISCMLEKQCVILKTGDWVYKANGRWKVLRKKEDRDAYLAGKLIGELFVFEGMEQKQGQKMIQGNLFNPGRSQIVPIELSAQTMRKTGKDQIASGDKPVRRGRIR